MPVGLGSLSLRFLVIPDRCRIFHGEPLAILAVVAGEVFHLALSLEHQEMIDHLIHEIAVVADDNHATGEIL